MIARLLSFLEFIQAERMRIDFATHPLINTTQPANDFPQTDIADDHQIDIAAGTLIFSGDGPEHEGNLHLLPIEGTSQNLHKTCGFQDDVANVIEKGMFIIGPVVKAIALSTSCDEIHLREIFQFLMHRTEGQSGLALDFPYVKLFIRNPEKDAKYLRPRFR
jgi:hypothetical protein